jgi:hypothetical protein
MGISKLSRRLDKVVRKARKTLGRRGKELAVAVLERAISIIESELKGAAAGKKEGPALHTKAARAKASVSRTTARSGKRRSSKRARRQGATAGADVAPKPDRTATGSTAIAAGTGPGLETGGPSEA